MVKIKQCDTAFARFCVLSGTILATAMASLFGASVSIALPTIQKSLGTTFNNILWVLNSYAIILATFILVSGSLGDYFGRKKVFSYGIVIFIIGSVFAGFSKTITQLISSQVLQGFGAALLIPGSLSLINISIPKINRGRAIGWWAGISGIIAAAGPFVGGWLVETFTWRSVFFFNIPFGIITLLLISKLVPESKNGELKKIDWLGITLIALSLFTISYGLIQASNFGWNNIFILLSIIVGIILLVFFIYSQKVISEPLIPPQFVKRPLVMAANAVTLFLYFALGGVFLFLIINLQQFQGHSPITSGLYLMPMFLIIGFLSGPAGSLADKIGPRLQMILGPFIVAVGIFLLTIPDFSSGYFRELMTGTILIGVGMSLVIAPLTKSALNVRSEYSGVASGVNNAVSRVAGLLAIAILGAVIGTIFTNQLTEGISQSEINSDLEAEIISQSAKLGAIEIPKGLSDSVSEKIEIAIRDSFLQGFRWAMGICATLAFLSSLISFFFIHNPVDVETD